ncbi:MAG: bL28 family ribosomal protein [Patescibacteria group bacterium]
MSNVCAITGKKTIVGGGYSNRTRATEYNPTGKTWKRPNIQRRRIYVPEIKKTFILNVSTSGLRTIQKKGAYTALKDAGLIKK